MQKLSLLPANEYIPIDEVDPIVLYRVPVIGKLYQQRILNCLNQLQPGSRVLEVGFGSGVCFPDLNRFFPQIVGVDLSNVHSIGQIQTLFRNKGLPVSLAQGNALCLPYADNSFDSVLLISILEHLQPAEQPHVMQEIRRVLKPGGQLVYGVPVERPFMVFMFRLLGYDIRQHHFSTEQDVYQAALAAFEEVTLLPLKSFIPGLGTLYETGHFINPQPERQA